MNGEDLTQDPIITRLIAEIGTQDPSPQEARTAVDRLNGYEARDQIAEGRIEGQGGRGIRCPLAVRHDDHPLSFSRLGANLSGNEGGIGLYRGLGFDQGPRRRRSWPRFRGSR